MTSVKRYVKQKSLEMFLKCCLHIKLYKALLPMICSCRGFSEEPVYCTRGIGHRTDRKTGGWIAAMLNSLLPQSRQHNNVKV